MNDSWVVSHPTIHNQYDSLITMPPYPLTGPPAGDFFCLVGGTGINRFHLTGI